MTTTAHEATNKTKTLRDNRRIGQRGADEESSRGRTTHDRINSIQYPEYRLTNIKMISRTFRSLFSDIRDEQSRANDNKNIKTTILRCNLRCRRNCMWLDVYIDVGIFRISRQIMYYNITTVFKIKFVRWKAKTLRTYYQHYCIS